MSLKRWWPAASRQAKNTNRSLKHQQRAASTGAEHLALADAVPVVSGRRPNMTMPSSCPDAHHLQLQLFHSSVGNNFRDCTKSCGH